MAEQHRFGDTHPATNAPTELKRKQALSVLQAPTDKQ